MGAKACAPEVLAGVLVTEVAGRYGVSRHSLHTWLRRYQSEGPPGLADRSHKVHQHPWQIPAELESAVCELRRAHPKWGPKRLVFQMGCRGLGTVTRSTVYRMLVRDREGARRLARRFRAFEDLILRFATRPDLDIFSNNEAGRTVRPVKVQQRGSGGCWRTLEGLAEFALVQSFHSLSPGVCFGPGAGDRGL